jgi:hypothetical protein
MDLKFALRSLRNNLGFTLVSHFASGSLCCFGCVSGHGPVSTA